MSSEGHLSVSQAISELTAAADAPPPEEKVEAAQEENTEAVPTADDATEAETPTGDETEEVEGETEGDEPVQPPLKAPHFWDTEDKDAFGKLSREDQERVLKYDDLGNKTVSKAQEKAAEARKIAEAEASRYAQYAAGLDKLVPEAKERFTNKWPENIDWNKVIDERGAEEALKLKNEYENDQKLVQQLETAKAEAERFQTEKFIADRLEKFKTVIPAFVDEKTGPETQMQVVTYLKDLGINPDVIIKRASAEELSVAYKAMLWDQAQKKATTLAAKPKPAAQPSKTTVRPTASNAPGSQQSQALKSARAAFNKDPSVNNLVKLQNLGG